MKFNVYGKKIEVVRIDEKWHVFHLGAEGKKRDAHDIFIPSSVRKDELKSYLEDLFHESATPENSDVEEIK